MSLCASTFGFGTTLAAQGTGQILPGTDLLKEMQQNFERDHPGVERLPYITKVLFPHAQNHWDMRYRALETSFVPLSE